MGRPVLEHEEHIQIRVFPSLYLCGSVMFYYWDERKILRCVIFVV
jgi:hypothetical protein